MKVNEELNALTVKGLHPFRFPIMPRLVAAVLMFPMLLVAMNLMALAGMVTVMIPLKDRAAGSIPIAPTININGFNGLFLTAIGHERPAVPNNSVKWAFGLGTDWARSGRVMR